MHTSYIPARQNTEYLREERLIHLNSPGQPESSNPPPQNPRSFNYLAPRERSFADIALNIDEIRTHRLRQTNEQYLGALHDAQEYQQRQLNFLTSERDFMQRGFDPRTGVSLGPKISWNGRGIGTYSLGWMQSRLNRSQRLQSRGRRGLPAWQVQQYQQGIAQLASMQQANMARHMQESMNLFASRKAEQLKIEQNPIIDAAVQRTVERRQEFAESLKGVVEVIATVISTIANLWKTLREDVEEKDKMNEKAMEKWITDNKAQLSQIAGLWGVPVKDIEEMIRSEEWSDAKLKKFIDAAKEAGQKLEELKKKLEGTGKSKNLGKYEITVNGITLKHPIGELHRVLGVSEKAMPVTVSFEKAGDAIEAFIEGYETATPEAIA